jgi:hypothetical protein
MLDPLHHAVARFLFSWTRFEPACDAHGLTVLLGNKGLDQLEETR